MVAPLLMAAGRAMMGKGARSVGATMMKSGSKTARSYGGEMMSTGKLPKDISKIAKFGEKSFRALGVVGKNTGKMLGVLSKHSPALKQQMIVLGKSISLFLRPIGDIMARWVRPMARWMIKFAMKWYKLFGGGGDDKYSDDYLEDEIKQLKVERDNAYKRGDTVTGDKLQSEIDIREKALSKSMWDSAKDFKIAWNNLTDTVKEAGDKLEEEKKQKKWEEENLGKFCAAPTNKAGTSTAFPDDFWTGAKTKMETGAEGFSTAFPEKVDAFWPGVETAIQTGATDAGKVVGKSFDAATGENGWEKKVWDNDISTAFDGASGEDGWDSQLWDHSVKNSMDGAKSWPSKLWTIMKGWFNDFWSSFRKDKDDDDDTDLDDSAVGGYVPKTGSYKLHAGERVITAGDVSRESGNSSINVTNHFNIQATLNNDLDINDLAAKLADLNETELRRRVSYI